jgi:hypothetical protein
MALRLLRHTRWIALLAACASSACGSSQPPPPDAFVAASVLDTQPTSMNCNVNASTTIVDIGAAGTSANEKPATVGNGGHEMGGQAVTVTCSVVASGSGFNVQLSAEQIGTGGGSLTITSPQPLDPVMGGTVSASWQNVNVGSYQQDGCMLTYTYQGAAVPSSAGPPIAAGRIWAHVSCLMATDNQQMPAPVCDGEADILFENCSQ